MPIVRHFKLRLNPGAATPPYINVNQYDKDEQWVFDLLTETGQRYVPTTGSIVGIKSDGHVIANAGTVNDSGQVIITETEQMTASAGNATFELLIDGQSHGTANFTVRVEARPGDNGDMSESDLSLLQSAVNSATEIIDIIGDTDLEEVVADDVNAWLDAHPEATTTVQDDSLTTAKYKNRSVTKAKLASDVFDILPSETASGDPAVFSDGADDVPVKSLVAQVNPVQDLHGYDHPWAGGAGKNKFSGTLYNGIIGSNGGYTSNDSRVTNVNQAQANILPVKAGTYTLSIDGLDFATVLTKDASYNTIDNFATSWHALPYTFTITQDGYLYFSARNSEQSDLTPSDYKPQLELGSTATSYEPYSNICPITGWDEVEVKRTGKNLFDISTVIGGFVSDNGVILSNTAWVLSDFIAVNGTFTAAWESTSNYWQTRIAEYDAQKNFIKVASFVQRDIYGHTYTVDAKTRYIRFGYTIIVSSQTIERTKIRINRGSEDLGYEPYTGTTYPVSFSQAGTVYGGTVDVVSGVLTVTHRYWTDAGTRNWLRNNDGSFYVPTGSEPSAQEATGKCNYAPYAISFVGMNVFVRNNPIDMVSLARDWGNIYPDVASLKAAFAQTPFQVVYPLATPITYQLTPTEVTSLLGGNVISADCGEVEVTYRADTKRYVDNRLTATKTIIAGIETSNIATKNYSVGDMLIIGDDLYRVTSAIANGGTITAGTNVAKTTVAEQLLALANA